MKRKYTIYGLFTALCTLLLCSCQTPLEQKREELGISSSGAYSGGAKIYFDQKSKADTLQHYSFGTQPIEAQTYEMKIPLRVIGTIANLPRAYQVEILAPKSTAIEGKHFSPLKKIYHFRAGEYTDTLQIELLRTALDPNVAKAETLTIALKPTNELGIAFEGQNHYTITLDNYLKEPDTWQYFTFFLGAYHRIKYLKLLEEYNNDETKFWDAQNFDSKFAEWMLNIKNVRDYFSAHPELGINDIPDPSAMIPFIE